MCQGALRDPWPSGRRAFSLWEPRSMAQGQEALNLGLLGQDAHPLPRRLPSRNVLQVCPWKLVRLVPHGAGVKYPHMSGLGAMCRGGMPRCVSASAARSVLSRNLLL